MNTHNDTAGVIEGLRQALPYLRLHRGKIFVLKLGGAITAGEPVLRAVLDQVFVLRELSIQVVIVHGGGPQITALADRLGLATRKVDGRRVTDDSTLEASILAMNGGVNTAILSACRAAKLPAVGLSGLDAGLLVARRRPPRMTSEGWVDFGLVGDLVSTDVAPLRAILRDGMVPVVSSLGATEDGTVLNLNADTVAAALAAALRAEKIVFLLDRPGLLEDPGDDTSLISYLDLVELNGLIEASVVSGGMLPKTQAARAALEGGVPRAHFIGAAGRDALLREVFTNEGSGTLLVAVRDPRVGEAVGALAAGGTPS